MRYIYILLLLFVFSCSKQDDCDNPVDCLPPLTTKGEGTIGCLIDDEPFKPGGSQLSGPTQQAFYQFVDGGYYFGLTANHRSSKKNIRIFIRNESIEENMIFNLTLDEKNSNFGEYVSAAGRYQTNNIQNGEIEFIKFDEENGIVSGTFWFDALSEDGEVAEIREGRFDMKYY
ncbi:DUF6252 family protein [Salegentibacter maritimus]|uniref:Lipoprotein n=1 Tax=Salegentibacter maritimus TaxID=2794347 RepID=A0ABS0TCN0_9FLAO|nr:DUF6252 family protein [Salegentibacter maritimus]MBI6118790.1 hypothetical protein [Salegentibacter maritimus]